MRERHCRAFLRPWVYQHRVEVVLYERDRSSGKTYAALPENIVLTEVQEFAEVAPSFTLDNAAAQELMDTLWQAGIRPTEGEGSAGAMAAVQAHLKDMRALVFDKKGGPT